MAKPKRCSLKAAMLLLRQQDNVRPAPHISALTSWHSAMLTASEVQIQFRLQVIATCVWQGFRKETPVSHSVISRFCMFLLIELQHVHDSRNLCLGNQYCGLRCPVKKVQKRNLKPRMFYAQIVISYGVLKLLSLRAWHHKIVMSLIHNNHKLSKRPFDPL